MSRMGYKVLFVDAINKCDILNYYIRKARRVTHSVAGEEIYDIAAASTVNIISKLYMNERLDRHVFVKTDSKRLFDV